MADGGVGRQNWRDGKNLLQCNRYMLIHEIGCDVRFTVGPPENRRCVSAHKSILVAGSDVFFAMFEGLLAEPNTMINIPDIDPNIFHTMLLYIYCEESKVQLNEVFPLMYAAQKYNVQGLVERCQQRMRTGISRENVCLTLMNTYLYDDEDTKRLCLHYIFLHSSDVFSSEGFLDLSEECLIEILRHHRVNMKEEEIFRAVVKWADKKCDTEARPVNGETRRQVMINISPFIRFARMESAYFSDKVSLMGILSDSQLIETFRFLTTSKADHPDPPRQQRLVFERFRRVMSGKGYFRGNADTISFISSKDAKLHEVFIYGSCQHGAMYQVKLCILEEGDNKVYEKNFELQTDGYQKTYPVTIGPPLKIKKDVCYTLLMVMTGPVSYYGQKGLDTLTTDGMTVTFLPNEQGLNGTNIQQGQFNCLVFEKV